MPPPPPFSCPSIVDGERHDGPDNPLWAVDWGWPAPYSPGRQERPVGLRPGDGSFHGATGATRFLLSVMPLAFRRVHVPRARVSGRFPGALLAKARILHRASRARDHWKRTGRNMRDRMTLMYVFAKKVPALWFSRDRACHGPGAAAHCRGFAASPECNAAGRYSLNRALIAGICHQIGVHHHRYEHFRALTDARDRDVNTRKRTYHRYLKSYRENALSRFARLSGKIASCRCHDGIHGNQ